MLSFVLIVASCGTPVLAESNTVNITTVAAPEEANIYAEEIAPTMIADVLEYPDLFDVEISGYQDWTLGQAFTIFNVEDNTLKENNIYYYPILEGEKIVIILSVFKVDGQWSASLSKSMADKLSNLSGTFILYEDDLTVYAESSNEKVKLMQDHKNTSNSTISNKSFSNKISILKNGYKNLTTQSVTTDLSDSDLGNELNTIQEVKNISNNSIINKSALGYTPGFTFNTATQVALNTYGYYKNQMYNGIQWGMCWAACVASVYNYRTGGSLEAYQVCEALEMDLDLGGTIYDIQKGLKNYNIVYRATTSTLSWDSYKSAINNKYPPILAAASGSYGHAITAQGYTTLDSVNKCVFWNPGTSTYESLTYSGKTFTYGGRTYTWVQTVYK